MEELKVPRVDKYFDPKKYGGDKKAYEWQHYKELKAYKNRPDKWNS